MTEHQSFTLSNSLSSFRSFVFEQYYKNRDERLIYRENSISFDEYFTKNRWFLKRMYKKEIVNVT